ncbi:MAG: hypothetical protein CMO81_10690 [Waddliaceae bacterium]|jgi:hypothetical protein|nr:hypothetical protein [Waddliaceae bacterium]MEC8066426.1 hypothetical protein [Pseudomonadota bacterium]
MTFRNSAIKSVDVLFHRFGKTARLIFADETEIEALVIHRLPDKITDVFDARVHSETDMFEVRLSDIPSGNTLGSIVVDDKRYTMQGEPIKDQHNLILKVDAYAV